MSIGEAEKKIAIVGGAITIIAALAGVFFWAAHLDTSVDMNGVKIESTKEDISKIEETTKEIKGELKELEDKIGSNSSVALQNIKTHDIVGNYASGLMGLSNPSLNGNKTSTGIILNTREKVCEINNNAFNWESKLGKKPYWGDFIEVQSTDTKQKTWLLVIGRYDGNNDYVLNTGRITFDNLGLPPSLDRAHIRIRFIPKSEWQANDLMLGLYEKIKTDNR